MDAVFGKKLFQNELAWKRTSSHSDAKRYASVSDRLLFYAFKGATWHTQYLPLGKAYVERDYRHTDKNGRYRVDNLTGPGLSDGESGEPWQGYGPGSSGRCWSVPKTGQYARWIEDNLIPGYGEIGGVHARLEALSQAGMIDWTSTGYPRLKRYLKASPGEAVSDFIADIQNVNNRSREHVGYPTQKPLSLYDRVIKASSNEGDVVLDPFAGCATTLLVAGRLGREWVGIDIWDKANEVVLDRFRKEGFSAKGHSGGNLAFGHVHYSKRPPKRTDDGQIAVPFLKVKEIEHKPRESTISRTSMFHQLIIKHGPRCQGCDRTFDDPRYLELDHRQPRSDGGSNELSNRILLCSPCNRLKSNTLTLIGLRRQNKKMGYMAGSEGENQAMRKIRLSRENAPKLFE